jgi:hypothetical protein
LVIPNETVDRLFICDEYLEICRNRSIVWPNNMVPVNCCSCQRNNNCYKRLSFARNTHMYAHTPARPHTYRHKLFQEQYQLQIINSKLYSHLCVKISIFFYKSIHSHFHNTQTLSNHLSHHVVVWFKVIRKPECIGLIKNSRVGDWLWPWKVLTLLAHPTWGKLHCVVWS